MKFIHIPVEKIVKGGGCLICKGIWHRLFCPANGKNIKAIRVPALKKDRKPAKEWVWWETLSAGEKRRLSQ